MNYNSSSTLQFLCMVPHQGNRELRASSSIIRGDSRKEEPLLPSATFFAHSLSFLITSLNPIDEGTGNVQ